MINPSKYLPTPEMHAEIEQYKILKTTAERAEFQEQRSHRLEQLQPCEREVYISNVMAGLNAAVEDNEDFIMANKLGKIAEAMSLSYIAKTYFGKSKEWLYQRLNGYMVNGKRAQFSNEEKLKFANALKEFECTAARNFA